MLGKMSKGVRIEWLSKKKYVSREKCNGDDVIVFYKKWLNPYFVIMKFIMSQKVRFFSYTPIQVTNDGNVAVYRE
jgi:hypothetical protein